MDTLMKKRQVIDEVLPIVDQLVEINLRLSDMPRSTVATRQLGLVIGKLQGWHREFQPRPDKPANAVSEPTKKEIDEALAALSSNKLNDRHKHIIEWASKKAKELA